MDVLNLFLEVPKTNLRRITAYLEPQLAEQLEEIAKRNRRSVSQQIAKIIEDEIQRENQKDEQH